MSQLYLITREKAGGTMHFLCRRCPRGRNTCRENRGRGLVTVAGFGGRRDGARALMISLLLDLLFEIPACIPTQRPSPSGPVNTNGFINPCTVCTSEGEKTCRQFTKLLLLGNHSNTIHALAAGPPLFDNRTISPHPNASYFSVIAW